MADNDNKIRYVTFDCETTMYNKVGSNKAHPMSPDNKAVWWGFKTDSYSHTYKVKETNGSPFRKGSEHINWQVIGFNMGFDVKYCMKDPTDTLNGSATFMRRNQWWDCQTVEYILSGQRIKMCSLADLQQSYLGTVTKDDKIKEYFEKGIGADMIPDSEIEPYLTEDVQTTEAIAMAQMKYLGEAAPEMIPLVGAMMEAKKAFVFAEYHGMKVDKEVLEKEAEALAIKKTKLEALLQVPVMTAYLDDGATFIVHKIMDLTSPKQLATWLFGGTVTHEDKRPDGFYKNGKPKFKKVVYGCDIASMVSQPTQKRLVDARTPSGAWSTTDDVLKQLLRIDPVNLSLLEVVLGYRNVNKELGTYYEGLLDRVFDDGFIYGNINTCVTSTGRTSSSDPNLQNIKNSPVKRAFVSRWGDDGRIVEFDYAQLEVVVLAHISKDQQLIDDIANGRDIHTELFRDMYGVDPTKEQRKAFKPLTFGLVYGAGYKSLAQNANVSEETAKDFIRVFFKRYPRVQEWWKNMKTVVDANASYMGHYIDNDGRKVEVKSSVYDSETGRKYVFHQYKSPWGSYSFSPNELANYPVQGMATGDIVPMMAGIVFHKVWEKFGNEALLINVIHDSYLFDAKKEHVTNLISLVKETLENAPMYYEQYFGKPFSFVNLKVGCNVGPNWFDMTEVNLEDY